MGSNMGTIQVFVGLQLLDLLTTLLGFKLGAAEASPFIRMLMNAGPTAGVRPSYGQRDRRSLPGLRRVALARPSHRSALFSEPRSPTPDP